MTNMIRNFYTEYDEDTNSWSIIEDGGGNEHGAFYDILLFCCSSKLDAEYAISLLEELQKGK